jgi:hypothetical protein
VGRDLLVVDEAAAVGDLVNGPPNRSLQVPREAGVDDPGPGLARPGVAHEAKVVGEEGPSHHLERLSPKGRTAVRRHYWELAVLYGLQTGDVAPDGDAVRRSPAEADVLGQ